MRYVRIVAMLAACVALSCVAAVPATAGPPPPCSKCLLYVDNESGADVHSAPKGEVIGWVAFSTQVYVWESVDSGVWCNVRFETGPNKGNSGWVLCGDLGP